MAKAIREHLIKALAKGEFVSGQVLGHNLDISRTAISKHIKALTSSKSHGDNNRLGTY